MTWAIMSIVANEMSPSGCSAYTYQQYSYQPYSRAPFFQMSEQLIDNANLNGGTHPAYPFLTGHGGANQVTVYGYLGLRLHPTDYMQVDPNLPPQIPNLRYRTFYWRGWPISAESNYTHTTLSRSTSEAPLSTADQTYAGSIPVHSGTQSNFQTYQLPAGGSIVIPNRMVSSTNTVSGNLVQCQPVSSSDSYLPGQFPISAVDGATSTKWQPATNQLSAMTVSFGDQAGQMVTGFEFNWAQAPPANATVLFHNQTIANPVQAYESNQNSEYQVVYSAKIKQSNPFTAKTNLNIIEIPQGNSTNVTLAHPVPAAKYASLLIEGNQSEQQATTGGTVAEWSIIGQNQTSSTAQPAKRKLDVRAAANLAESGSFMRRRQGLPAV